MRKFNWLIIAFLFIQDSFAAVWQIGPTRFYTMPSQVSTLVANGDTVNIDVGTYMSDVSKWTASDLLIRGVNGMAVMNANNTAYGRKGIFVIDGNNCTIENIEFSFCHDVAGLDKNWAGIRFEASGIAIRHCYFHDNDDGILDNGISTAPLLIEFTEFGNNGYGDGFSHNLYINHSDTLIFRYNYSHHAIVGHELKSRAHVNFILYNRISDEATGSASRSIDLPNGGPAYIIGNVIEQGPLTQNSNIIGYGLEGLTNPAPFEVYAINNTMVNDRSGGSFFSFQTGTALFKGYNNIIAGSGSFVTGTFPTTVDTTSNLVNTNINSFAFVDASQYDYHLTSGSVSAIDFGTAPGSANSVSLTPVMEYVHPASSIGRCVSGNLDVGAYEYCASVQISELTNEDFLIFPNPANDFINVGLPVSSYYLVEIYSSFGERIMKTNNISKINVAEFPNGVYILKLIQENKVLTTKIVKQ